MKKFNIDDIVKANLYDIQGVGRIIEMSNSSYCVKFFSEDSGAYKCVTRKYGLINNATWINGHYLTSIKDIPEESNMEEWNEE